jgi:hypothetical protein
LIGSAKRYLSKRVEQTTPLRGVLLTRRVRYQKTERRFPYLISRDFVKLWEPQYDTQKYPEDFYLRYSDSARNTAQPEQLKEYLLALLHWKDGKAVGFVSGENNAKPNTLNPILSLKNTALTDFWQRFKDLSQADDKDILPFQERFKERLMDMWSTVVIPAFLLNVARPDRLPIIDQHTVRAFLALTCGKVVEKPNITWNVWREYVTFFQKAVIAAGYDHNSEERCYVDRALFSWGKSLKGKVRRRPISKTYKQLKSKDKKIDPKINRPILWGQQIPKTGVIPPSCNVLKALNKYIDTGSLDELPQYKKQNLRDLQFHRFRQILLHELLQESSGKAARQLLHHYKEKMGGKADISRLPRPIIDVFLVGWTSLCGINGTVKKAIHLHKSGFGGTRNASMAAVSVGKSTGQLFGLLDASASPTALFHDYFDVQSLF